MFTLPPIDMAEIPLETRRAARSDKLKKRRGKNGSVFLGISEPFHL